MGSLLSVWSLRIVHPGPDWVHSTGNWASLVPFTGSPAGAASLFTCEKASPPERKKAFRRCRLELFLSKSKTVSGEIMGSVDQSFPVSCKQLSVDIKGNNTEVVLCSYDDHFLVIVTQIGTMGTILHARKEEGMSVLPTFNVSVVFGKRDEPMLTACARQLIEHISNSGSSRQLVLSLGLKDHSMETLRGVVSAVTENRLW